MPKRNQSLLVSSLFLLIVVSFAVGPAAAKELPRPSGRVILTIEGNIQHTNGPGRADFDFAMLQELGFHSLHTHTPWTEGKVNFEGVRAEQLLAAVGASGDILHTIALNDYAVNIPISDVRDYPVIIALKMNGKKMRIRDKGPAWVVYPIDDHPEIPEKIIRTRMIWQLSTIEVQ